MAARVGLTGGIGSGKTTVADYFAGLGVNVIAADKVARELTETGSEFWQAILNHFGADEKITDADGKLNRRRLGEIVFSDAKKRATLEKILHPPIRRAMFARAAADANAYCILDIPLLVESKLYIYMQHNLTLICDEELRIARLQKSRGMDAELIKRILKTQANDAMRAEVVDDVVDNNSNMKNLSAQVTDLHKKYMELFG